MQPMIKSVKKYLRQLREQPARIKSAAHVRFPQVFGFEVSKPMVQFYRNDSVFRTLLSFNHFIEVFAEYQGLTLDVRVEAFDRSGQSLGVQTFKIEAGARQFYLEQLFKNLDEYGMFTLAFKLDPAFVDELSFLQKLSSQFMTVYVPQDSKSAPQMVHSHKEQQGSIWLSRNLKRRSSSIESFGDIKKLEFYFINPSASEVDVELAGMSLNHSSSPLKQNFKTKPYSCVKIEWPVEVLANEDSMAFVFTYNKNINHKKPIVFRQFQSDIWSCNHT